MSRETRERSDPNFCVLVDSAGVSPDHLAAKAPTILPSVIPVASEAVVLVAWDDKYGLQVIKALLSAPEFRVLTAKDGVETLKVYRDHLEEVDLVLLNMSLPRREDGPATFDALRAVNPAVRCAIMSGFILDEEVNELTNRGAVGVLLKPWRPDEFVKSIREWTGR